MIDEEATPKRRWRPRFSLLTLVMGVVFIGACGGLWWRWEPWFVEVVLSSPGSDISEVEWVPQTDAFYVRQFGFGKATDPPVDRDAIHIFDTPTRRLRCTLPLNRALEVTRLPGFSPDGRYMVSYDGSRLVLYDLINGRPVALERSSGSDQQYFGFADRGRLFAYLTDGACGQRELRTRDAQTGREWPGFGRPVFSLRTVSDQPWAFCICKRGHDTESIACDLRTGEALPPGLPSDFTVVQTDCDAKATMLVVGGVHLDGTPEVVIWQPEGKAPRFLSLGSSQLSPYFHLSPDGHWLTVQTGPPAVSLVFNPLTGERTGRLPDEWNATQFLPNDRALLYKLAERSPSGLRYRYTVWDLVTQAVVSELEGKMDIQKPLQVSRDGQRLISVSYSAVWDLESGRLLFSLKESTRAVQCAPDGSRFLVDGGYQQPLSILDATTGAIVHVLEEKSKYPIRAFFFPDGKRLLIGTGQEVRIWSRRRPEYWWGIAWLPEFWIALVSGVGLVAMAVRRLRSRKSS